MRWFRFLRFLSLWIETYCIRVFKKLFPHLSSPFVASFSELFICSCQQSTLVQGTVPAALSLTFRERLSEGSIYTLSGFDVTRSSPKYRLSDGPIAIRFNEGTAFEKLPTTTKVLPTEHFRFQPYDHMLELANTGKQLPGNHFFSVFLRYFPHITV